VHTSYVFSLGVSLCKMATLDSHARDRAPTPLKEGKYSRSARSFMFNSAKIRWSYEFECALNQENSFHCTGFPQLQALENDINIGVG
jgi:hypothetical protein